MKTILKAAFITTALMVAQPALAHDCPTDRDGNVTKCVHKHKINRNSDNYNRQDDRRYDSMEPRADYRYDNWNGGDRNYYRNDRMGNRTGSFWGYKVDTYRSPEDIANMNRAVQKR